MNDAGQTLIPLLIFDQFEEIFTLAQTDEAGRARAARFIDDLADLVENRPPQELEAKLEADDAAAERFDFARGDYRVLISLREDYLAPLESLKAKMPSITQNRLRLAPMTGKQGLEAVMGPGKGLVSQEVAEAIVRFVAGGAEIANAEVEPSLLSLVCRELNDTRIAEGREEISLDLLAGSHDSILSNFYERALADQPASVRRIIEDELLTESGFRENVAEETAARAFRGRGRRAGDPRDARQPAPAAHRGAARRAPRRADARRPVRRRQGQPQPAARARSARGHRADAGGAERPGRGRAPRDDPRAPGGDGLRRARRRRDRRGDLRVLQHAAREARRGRRAAVAGAGRGAPRLPHGQLRARTRELRAAST